MSKNLILPLLIFGLWASSLQGLLTQQAVSSGYLTVEEDTVYMRTFYEKDEAGRQTAIIIDDGTGKTPEDLTNVTIRLIERFSTKENGKQVENYYLDIDSGLEIPLNKSLSFFNEKGDLTEEFVNDSFHRILLKNAFSTEEYDSDGRALAFEKDEAGRLLSITDSNNEIVRNFTYDSDGRITSNKEGHVIEYPEPGVVVTRYPDGQEKKQIFDSKGRPTLTFGPCLPETSPLLQEEIRYNENGNITYHQLQPGKIWQANYNEKGQPLCYLFPDGTQEFFSYDQNGTLASKTNRNGILEKETRDALGRVIYKEFIDRNGNHLYDLTTQYSLAGPKKIQDSRGKTTLFTYDGAGRLTSEEIVDNKEDTVKKSRYLYGIDGQVEAKVEVDTQEERWTWYERDSCQKVIALRVENRKGEILCHIPVKEPKKNNHDQDVVLDHMGRVTLSQKLGQNGTLLKQTVHQYEENRHLIKEERIVEGESLETITLALELDKEGRVVAVTEDAESCSPSTTHYSYNQWGEITNITKPDGTVLYHTYGADGKLVKRKSSTCDLEETFVYDSYGRIVSFSDTNGTTYRQYDLMGNLISETNPFGITIEKEYDALGRCTYLHLPDGSGIRYNFDAYHLLSVERVDQHSRKAYEHNYDRYDWEGNLLSSTLAHGTGTLSYVWNSQLKKPTAIISPFWEQAASYNEDGILDQLLTVDICGALDQHFLHDEEQHLVEELTSSDLSITEKHYLVDSLDNRVQKNNSALELNGQQQLLSDENWNYSYDANGNLISKVNSNKKTDFIYDSRDRLISIQCKEDYRVDYLYDPLNRILSETRYLWKNNNWSVLDTNYRIYDDFSDIGTCDSEGTLLNLKVKGQQHIGSKIDSCVAVEIREDNELCAYASIHNLLGSLSCLVDKEGEIVHSYRYDAFGLPLTVSHKRNSANPWTFSGKRWDPQTELFHFDNRLYDPNSGRWLSKDPTGRSDGPNRYAYVHNNPLHYVDPQGLWSVGNWFEAATNWVYEEAQSLWERITMSPMHSGYYLLQDLIPGQEEHQHAEESLGSFGGLLMTGFKPQVSETGVIGKGEIDNKVRLTCLNGILVENEYSTLYAEQLSASHGNTNVHYVYRASHGWTWDMGLSVICRAFDYNAEQSFILSEKWKALIQEMGGPESGGIIIHYAHSMGGADSIHAKQLLSLEEQKMIRIITLGSPRMAEDESTNYVSMRDGVSLAFDSFNIIKSVLQEETHIVLVGSFFDGLPLCDHFFAGETYRLIWENLGNEFVEQYGFIP